MLKKGVLVLLPLLASCTYSLYEETDIHYTEKCGSDKRLCEQAFSRFGQLCAAQHKGKVISENVGSNGVLYVQCRPKK